MNFRQGSVNEILKDGVKHLSDKDLVVVKNIEAVKKMSSITRTSMGPNGLNKLIINHLGRLFVSHDSSTIMKELEIIHPAARMVVVACQSQEMECGDGTNFIVSFCAELLNQAQSLLVMGLHSSDIIQGYERAKEHALKLLKNDTSLTIDSVKDLRNPKEIKKGLYSAICAKEYSYVKELVDLVCQSCLIAYPKKSKTFNVDNVRVVKITGGYISDSRVIKGFVLGNKDTKGIIKHVKNAKIAVFAVSLDSANTETSGELLLSNAKELMNIQKSEETEIEGEIKKLADLGINVVVSKGKIGDLAMHYLEKHKIMAIKIQSKFDLLRLCRAVDASAMTRVGVPTKEEIGLCSKVDVVEISGKKCIIFSQEEDEDTRIATVILRGATDAILKEMEKAIDDGVNVFKTLTRDSRLVGGAGAFEMEMYKKLTSFGEDIKGLDQYSIRKFAESFLIIPKTIAECSGFSPTNVITNLRVAHQEGKINFGVDLDSEKGIDAKEKGILDCLETKKWAIRLATQAAVSILSVDQIIMARPSGGPQMKPKGDWDTD